MNILYLTHDLSDPMTHKRVRMLVDGGATVTIAGFRREAQKISQLHGCPVIHFGRTFNGRFLLRVLSVLFVVFSLVDKRALFAQADVILARNLEMLAIGVRGRALAASKSVLVYESLDIHRLLLNGGPIGKNLRRLEGWLIKRASLLITSSPAFITEYFETRSSVRLPTLLLENKVYIDAPIITPSPRAAHAPWRIGWFGAIRCAKSLALLRDLTNAMAGQVEVIIRGRPAYDQLPDFDAQLASAPHITFHGPYKNPDDLATIYGDVHFSWAIDMFEEGLNSAWLMPNRIYEGGLFGAVPITAQGLQTSRFTASYGIGVALDEPKQAALTAFFNHLTGEQYQRLQSAVTALPRSTWACERSDCIALVNTLAALKPAEAA